MTDTYAGSLGMLKLTGIVWSGLADFLKELPRSERAIHIFWLLGPFILLIERTPSDIWISVIGLAYVMRVFIRRERAWLSRWWVRAGFVFWAVCIVSAFLSPLPAYSLGEAVAWFRFPLFAMAVVFWLGRDRRMVFAMLVSCGIGMVVMCGILVAELVMIGQQAGRLSWPYGDLVPGSYLAKAALPAYLVATAFMMYAIRRSLVAAALVGVGCLIMVLMTGERINFLICLFAGALASLVWRPNTRRFLLLFGVAALAVSAIMSLVPEILERFINNFLHHIPTHADSAYFNAIMPGIIAFQDAMILGIGPGNFRELCVDIIRDAPGLDCHPHPHNFYIQMAAEVGIVGLVCGILFLGSIIWACAVPAIRDRSNVVVATMWIVPFALFWPIASTADFFGQWNNIFMWSAVALALAGAQIGSADEPRPKV